MPDVPTVTASAKSLCLGSTALLIVSNGSLNDASNWQWHTDSCNGPLAGTGDSIYITPKLTTTYFVRGEGGCVTNANCQTITIKVNLIPTLTASANPNTLCAGSNVTLHATGSGKISWNRNVTDGLPFLPSDSAT